MDLHLSQSSPVAAAAAAHTKKRAEPGAEHEPHGKKARSSGGGGGAAAAAGTPPSRKRKKQAGGAAAAAAADQPEPQMSGRAPAGAKRFKGGAPPLNTAMTALDALLGTQTKYCQVMNHPVREIARERLDILNVWELQFDADQWTSNPFGFTSLRGTHHDTALMILRLIVLFGYLANQVVATKYRKVKGDDGEESTVAEPPQSIVRVTWERVPHKSNPNKFVVYRLRITEYAPPSSSGLFGEFIALLKRNERDLDKQRVAGGVSKGKIPMKPESYTHLTQMEWRKLSLMYNPNMFRPLESRDPAFSVDLYDGNSPFNPTRLFDVAHNLEQARRLDADPRYCDPDTYLQGRGTANLVFGFAEGGKNTWQIAETDLDPRELGTRYLPHMSADRRLYAPEKARFAKQHGLVDPNEIEAKFNLCNLTSINQPANDMDALTKRISDEWKELTSKYAVAGSARHTGDTLLPEFWRARRVKQIEFLEQLGDIISPTGDCPPSMQAIARAMQYYLTQNDNTLCVPHDQWSFNLTRFADERAEDFVTLNSVMDVISSHQDCFLFLCAALHVYARVDMNPHQLQLGPPSVGKSFALILLTRLLLEGTWRMLSYMTPKALAVPGKQNACLIMIMEDAPSSTFGVTGGSGGKGGQKGATSDVENMIKQFLTSKFIAVQTITMEPKRAGEFIRSDTSCVVFAAMNDDSTAFPKPMLSRFCVSISAEDTTQQSDDGGANLVGRAGRAGQAPMVEAMALMGFVWSRRQILIAYLFHMESCGILKTIDVACADMVFAIVARLTAKRGLVITAERRAIDRFRMIVRVLVALNAISLVWSTPDSPVLDTPHSIEHFLLTEKHLFATVEIAIFALGLTSRQWQDNVRAHIILAMKEHWFPRADEAMDKYKTLAPLPYGDVIGADAPTAPAPEVPDGVWIPNLPAGPGASARGPPSKKVLEQLAKPEVQRFLEEKQAYDGMEMERKMWMYDSCQIGGREIPAMPANGARVPTIDDQINFLADQIMPVLPKKYLKAEVVGKIKAMTTDMVSVRRLQCGPYGEPDPDNASEDDYFQQERQQLVIEPGYIRLAIPVLQQAKDGAEVLFQCAQDAVSIIHFMTKSPMTHKVMYAEPEPESQTRYIMRMCVADPNIDKRYVPAEICRISNPAFASGATKVVTQNMLKSVDPNYYDEGNMFRLFSADLPFTVINMDMDVAAALRRADDLGLSAADQHQAPSNDPTVYNRVYHAHYHKNNANRMMYPDCFSERNRPAFLAKWEARFKRSPDDFMSTSEHMRLLRRQQARPSVYDKTPRQIKEERELAFAAAAAAQQRGMEEKKQQWDGEGEGEADPDAIRAAEQAADEAVFAELYQGCD